MSIRRCGLECCWDAQKCMHANDPIFPGTNCGQDVIDGGYEKCRHPEEHPNEILDDKNQLRFY